MEVKERKSWLISNLGQHGSDDVYVCAMRDAYRPKRTMRCKCDVMQCIYGEQGYLIPWAVGNPKARFVDARVIYPDASHRANNGKARQGEVIDRGIWEIIGS